jgi:hypothetical protein
MKAIHIAAARQRTRARELRQIASHEERMAACLVCGRTPGTGRLCPDCYVCSDCGPKCDECSDIPRT